MAVGRTFATVAAAVALLLLSACTPAVTVGQPTTPAPRVSAAPAAVSDPATPTADGGTASSPAPAAGTQASGGTQAGSSAEAATSVSVSGFDARQVWELCKAEGIRSAPTITDYQPFDTSDVAPATDGNGVTVQVHWRPPVEQATADMFWICGFNGDPANPTRWLFSSNLK
ncbi:MAG: hypothetical protein ABI255_01370 [Microbacteriaceae bacterium]